MPSTPPSASESFEPGQVGIRHLLGAMAVVAIVAALSAGPLRSLPRQRVGEVVLHWISVWGIAGAIFYSNSLRQRRHREVAGRTSLRVLCIPMSEGQRQGISWLLTAAVVADGVFMSALILPQFSLWELWHHSPYHFCLLIGGQAALWGYCLIHWLTNIYWVEFCQNGLLTYSKYYPWRSVSRIGWSPVKPSNLVVLHDGFFNEMRIDSSARDDVNQVLESLRLPPPDEKQ